MHTVDDDVFWLPLKWDHTVLAYKPVEHQVVIHLLSQPPIKEVREQDL